MLGGSGCIGGAVDSSRGRPAGNSPSSSSPVPLAAPGEAGGGSQPQGTAPSGTRAGVQGSGIDLVRSVASMPSHGPQEFLRRMMADDSVLGRSSPGYSEGGVDGDGDGDDRDDDDVVLGGSAISGGAGDDEGGPEE